MKVVKRQVKTENFKLLSCVLWRCFFSFSLLAFLSSSTCLAVTSKITRHSSGEDLLKGEVENVVVSSEGTLQIGRAAEAARLADGHPSLRGPMSR